MQTRLDSKMNPSKWGEDDMNQNAFVLYQGPIRHSRSKNLLLTFISHAQEKMKSVKVDLTSNN